MRRAFTVIELLVILSVAALLAAALLPAIARVRGNAGQITSMENLQTLSFALAMYAWDHDDRQPTWVPDDAGRHPRRRAPFSPRGPAHPGAR